MKKKKRRVREPLVVTGNLEMKSKVKKQDDDGKC